jgi:hypothetical protein
MRLIIAWLEVRALLGPPASPRRPRARFPIPASASARCAPARRPPGLIIVPSFDSARRGTVPVFDRARHGFDNSCLIDSMRVPCCGGHGPGFSSFLGRGGASLANTPHYIYHFWAAKSCKGSFRLEMYFGSGLWAGRLKPRQRGRSPPARAAEQHGCSYDSLDTTAPDYGFAGSRRITGSFRFR